VNAGQKQDKTSGRLDPQLMRYIWTHSKPQQLWIFLVVLFSMPTYYLLLDLPKVIVNSPIQGRGFETPDAKQVFFDVSIPLPHWLTQQGSWKLFSGFELSRLETLMALSGLFLFLVVANGAFKLYINTYKGKLGERMLRRLRYDLVDCVLRFPIPHFRRVKSSEVATMVKDEIEPLGGFIGDSYVQPLYMGGQALTAITFIITQHVWLGLMAIAMVATQASIIPRLRRRLIVLGRERQLAARELAGRVGEIVDGINAIHINDTSNYERAELKDRLGRIYWIRFELYQRKFLIKFINNFLAQLTPFLFYSLGGYLALQGKLDIGQLVTVIAAYKELPPPVKELIDWDQQRIDVQTKFTQVVDQFTQDGMLNPELQRPLDTSVPNIVGPITIANLSITDDTGMQLVQRASVVLQARESVAVVGRINSGADAFGDAVARLVLPNAGKISVNGENLFELPEAFTGQRIGYAGSDAFLPQSTVRDTLLYVLKHRPIRPAAYAGSAKKKWEAEQFEARQAGNTHLDINDEWIDYDALGVNDAKELLDHIRRVSRIAALDEDIFSLGLRGFIENDYESMWDQIVLARKELRSRLTKPALTGLVEPLDPHRYNSQATLIDNLLFGSRIGHEFSDANLAENSYLKQILKDTQLDAPLFEMGREIALTTIELFKDLPPDHPFFEQLSFMSADQIPDYLNIINAIQGKDIKGIPPEQRWPIVQLSFAYIEPRHRLGLISHSMMAQIVQARHAFRSRLPSDLATAIEFYDPERYNKATTIQDNILLGRIAHGVAEGPERVVAAIRSLLQELNLEDIVFNSGLEFHIGSGGARLSEPQRAKIMVARALIKRPDYAIFRRPLSVLDLKSQESITHAVLEHSRKSERPFGVLWVLSNASSYARKLVTA
jgi:putative ABC transport system ATP-binding protein